MRIAALPRTMPMSARALSSAALMAREVAGCCITEAVLQKWLRAEFPDVDASMQRSIMPWLTGHGAGNAAILNELEV